MQSKQVRSGAKGIYGAAQVRVTKTTVQIKMDKVKNEETGMETGGESYEISRENCPKGIEAGHWSVALSSKGDKLFGYRPLSGTFAAEFLKFAASENQLPTWAVKTNKWGNATKTFTAIILADKEYEYPVSFSYRFAENDDGNAFVAYSKLGVGVQKLMDFLAVCGVEDISYSENVLPELEKDIKSRKPKFLVKVSNGWIDSFAPTLTSRNAKKTSKK